MYITNSIDNIFLGKVSYVSAINRTWTANKVGVDYSIVVRITGVVFLALVINFSLVCSRKDTDRAINS